MRICVECFADDEIINFINSSSATTAICDCCGAMDYTIDLMELSDFFSSILSLYEIDTTSSTKLYSFIQKQWNIFKTDEIAQTVLRAFLKSEKQQLCYDSTVKYIDEIRECLTAWQNLKENVLSKFRYFSDISSFAWENYIRPNFILKKDTILYRARIIPKDQMDLKCHEMGCPPSRHASAGRANPIGIPYLYLCDNPSTTLYETRSVYLDRVAIGHFKVIRDLNIVNFNEQVNLFYASSIADTMQTTPEIVKQRLILDSISKDLSKPLRRFDTELEYIPTQLICEYCKQNGADGIKFTSSLSPEGNNIVLFDSADAACIKVNVVEVTKVSITFNPES